MRRVPPARRYYGTLRLPPPFPPHLITRDGYRRCACVRSRGPDAGPGPGALRLAAPRQLRTETDGPLKFPGNPSVPMPCSQTPAGPLRQAIRRSGAAPVEMKTKATHDIMTFEAQSHGFSTRCLRFAHRLSPPDARLASAVGQLYGAGLQPAGFRRKVSSMLLHRLLLSWACLTQHFIHFNDTF